MSSLYMEFTSKLAFACMDLELLT